MRYFAQISYEGTKYNGWQRQTSTSNTVQQYIEEALSNILKNNIYVSACGRTDKGVHAQMFYLHFDVYKPWNFDLVERLNRNLPESIKFNKIFEIHDNANARFDATSRTYKYYFHTVPSPFLNVFSTYVDRLLDIQLMMKALKVIERISDFKNFCKQPEKHRTTVCEIFKLQMHRSESGNRYFVEFKANRFLRGMIRILMNAILEVGAKSITLEDLERLVDQEIPSTSKSAYPQGLHLTKITYPYVDQKLSTIDLYEFDKSNNWKPIDLSVENSN